MCLPQRQTRVSISGWVREIDSVVQHLDGTVHLAKIDQLTADPIAFLHAKVFVTDSLVDQGVWAELEILRLAINDELHGGAVPRREHTLLPLECSLLTDEPKQNLFLRQPTRRRQNSLLYQECEI